MKFVSLLLWVTQFGFSAIFPRCFFLLAASWLRNTYDLGIWVMIVAGVLAEKLGSDQKPVAFNDHD